MKKLGEFLVANYKPEGEKAALDVATSWVYLYELDYGYADVLDYAQRVAEFVDDATLKAQAQTIADNLKKAIEAAYVYRISATNIKDANEKPVTTKAGTFSVSISLYAGQDKSDFQYTGAGVTNYKASAFDKAVGWSKWMDINEKRVSADDEHPNLSNPGNDSNWDLFWLDE